MKIFSWLSFNFDVFFTGWLFNFFRQVLVWPRKSCMSTCISNKNFLKKKFFNWLQVAKFSTTGFLEWKVSNCCEVRGFCGYFHRKQNNMTYFIYLIFGRLIDTGSFTSMTESWMEPYTTVFYEKSFIKLWILVGKMWKSKFLYYPNQSREKN